MTTSTKHLQQTQLRYIPRRTPITDEEILQRWLPSLPNNICFVAEDQRRCAVIGCITYLSVPTSSAYENESQRRIGEIAGTTSPDYEITDTFEITKQMNSALIVELKQQQKTGFLRVAIESPTIQAMQELGYEGTLVENLQHYKEAGLSGQAREYMLP